jgi:rhodanese-related sulfurtransferase
MDINVQELKKRLDEGDASFIFIDVREPYEYAEFNLGAKLVPLGTIPTAMAELEDVKNEEIVVHCRSGARSGQAKAFLMAHGFQNVRNLEGGVLAWQSAFGK